MSRVNWPPRKEKIHIFHEKKNSYFSHKEFFLFFTQRIFFFLNRKEILNGIWKKIALFFLIIGSTKKRYSRTEWTFHHAATSVLMSATATHISAARVTNFHLQPKWKLVLNSKIIFTAKMEQSVWPNFKICNDLFANKLMLLTSSMGLFVERQPGHERCIPFALLMKS